MAMVLGNANNAMMLMMATMMVRIGEVGLKFCPVSILPRPWQWCRCRTWSHLSFPPWWPKSYSYKHQAMDKKNNINCRCPLINSLTPAQSTWQRWKHSTSSLSSWPWPIASNDPRASSAAWMSCITTVKLVHWILIIPFHSICITSVAETSALDSQKLIIPFHHFPMMSLVSTTIKIDINSVFWFMSNKHTA